MVGTSLAVERKTGQRRVALAYEILFLFFSNGIVHSNVMDDIIQSSTTCTLIIKQVLPKYSDSYIFIWHSKFTNCLTWPTVDVLPYIVLVVCPTFGKNFKNHSTAFTLSTGPYLSTNASLSM